MSFGALPPPTCSNCKGKYLLKYERDNPPKKTCQICSQPTGNDLINVCLKCVGEKGICQFCAGPLVSFLDPPPKPPDPPEPSEDEQDDDMTGSQWDEEILRG